VSDLEQYFHEEWSITEAVFDTPVTGVSLFARVYGITLTRMFYQLENALEKANMQINDVFNQRLPAVLASGVNGLQTVIESWLDRFDRAARYTDARGTFVITFHDVDTE
jgi:hypothetical protein